MPLGLGLVRCAACGAPVAYAGAHWLCAAHRRERGRAVAREASEAEVLGRLVFDFPQGALRYDEFRARAMYVAEVWDEPDKPRAAALAHACAVRVTRPVERREVLELVGAFVAFVCRHVHLAPASLGAACADRVREMYPRLASAGPRAALLRGERMVRALTRATGVRAFLVLADVAAALAPRLPADAAERVYAAYLASLWDAGGATHIEWGRARVPVG